MIYRRVMRIPSLRKVAAPLAGIVLVLAGCGAEENAPPAAAGPCAIVENGTPAPKTSEAAPAGSPTTSRNISTNPEVATGYRKDMTVVHTAHYAVATANPLATRAACEVLKDGGTAADALVTAQAVLGLVEPQSSGIGGGGFLLYYDAQANSVQAYDGRETAPAAATENYLRWISDTDRTEPEPDARASGRSIGVPGILRLLMDVHKAARQDRLARPVHPCRHAGRRRLRHQPEAGRRHRRRRATVACRCGGRRLLPQPRRQPRNHRSQTHQPRVLKDSGRHRIRPAVVLHGRHRQHRRRGRRHLRRPHPEPDDDEDLAGYTAKQREPLCTPLPRQGDLRHAASVIRRHRGSSDSRNARALRDERAQTQRYGPQRGQTLSDGCAPDLGGGAAGLRRPRQVRRRHRFRAAAGWNPEHAAEQQLPGASGPP